MKGIITAIQRMSIHDGPGLRSTLFMKGCNLRCRWCHNPETWSPLKQLQHIPSRCMECHTCQSVCRYDVFSSGEGSLELDRKSCILCGDCVENCPGDALSIVGREITAGDAAAELLSDKVFFETAGGGVTISGGEPLLQAEFCREVLEICKNEDVHTAIESNLTGDWQVISGMSDFVDLWMCDLKVFDSDKHKYWTGAGNERIMDNLARLAKTGAEMIVRTPVIPGVNDNEYEIKNICGFLKKIGGNVRYELLKFHNLGFGKFDNPGMTNEMDASAHLEDSTFEQLNEIVKSNYFPKP